MFSPEPLWLIIFILFLVSIHFSFIYLLPLRHLYFFLSVILFVILFVRFLILWIFKLFSHTYFLVFS